MRDESPTTEASGEPVPRDGTTGNTQVRIWRISIWKSIVVAALLLATSIGSLEMTRGAEEQGIDYCVFAHELAGARLNVSLLQQQLAAPVAVRTTRTGPDGCGTFPGIPHGHPVMIVVWTDDGFSTGSTGWRDLDERDEIVTIQLKSQESPLSD